MRKFLSGLLLVLLSPLLLVLGLAILLMLPFWMLSYKRSPWYRDKGEKYTFGINSACYYKIYNLASKKSLPLAHRKIADYHFFFCEDRVLFPLGDQVDDLFYSEEEQCFMVLPLGEENEVKEAVPLAAFLKGVYEKAAFKEGTEVWIVLSEGALGDHAKEGRDLFAMYADKGDLKTLLSLFCERQGASDASSLVE